MRRSKNRPISIFIASFLTLLWAALFHRAHPLTHIKVLASASTRVNTSKIISYVLVFTHIHARFCSNFHFKLTLPTSRVDLFLAMGFIGFDSSLDYSFKFLLRVCVRFIPFYQFHDFYIVSSLSISSFPFSSCESSFCCCRSFCRL